MSATIIDGKTISKTLKAEVRADVDALVDRAVAEFGQLDIMCNIAGIGFAKSVMDTTEAAARPAAGARLPAGV